MLKQSKDNKEKDIPEVKFTIKIDNKTDEEKKREIEDLLKKRNELLASLGITVPDNTDTNTNESKNEYPQSRR